MKVKMFFKKMQDMYATSYLKRLLIGVPMFAVGLLLGNLGPVFAVISLPLAYVGIFSVLSFSAFQTACRVSSNDGVNVVSISDHTYIPLPLFNVFSPFMFIPCRTRYYIVKNMPDVKWEKEKPISAIMLNSPLVVLEPIEKPKKGQLCHKQAMSQTELAARRNRFLADMKDYFADGTATELFANDYASICTIQEKGAFLFTYEDYGKGQFGHGVSDAGVEQIRSKMDDLFDVIMCQDVFNDKLIQMGQQIIFTDTTPKEDTDTTDFM